MDRMIYTAMNGASQIMLRQTSNNNNLANLDTTGFRADLDAFASLPVYGPGHPSRVYSQDQRAGVDFSAGRIYSTGNELDIAINGDGFIAVQSADGIEAYTRAGDLRITNGGLLQTTAGYTVIGNSGPIAIPPFEKLEIGGDGTISIQPLGQATATLAVLDRIKLVTPTYADVHKGADGLFYSNNEVLFEPDASVKIISSSLESSNVNAVDALVEMIQLSRNFEMQIKLMKAAEDADAASAKLLSFT